MSASLGDVRSKVGRLVRSSALLYLASSVLSRAGAVILIPLYTRRLDEDEYGTLGMLAALATVLPAVLSLGLYGGLARAFFEAKGESASERVGDVARGHVVITTSLGLLGLAGSSVWPDGLWLLEREHLVLLVITAVGQAIATIPATYLRASERALAASGLQILTFLVNTSLALVLVLGLDRGLRGILEANALGAALMGTIGLWFTFRVLGSAQPYLRSRAALAWSLPLVPHFLATWAHTSADRVVLSSFGAASELGTYFLGVQLLTPIALAVGAWNDAESPRHGRIRRDEGTAALRARLPLEMARYAAVAGIPLVLMLALTPLLQYVVGPRFTDALWVLPWLGMSSVVDALYLPNTNLLFYAGKTRFIPVVTVVSALVSITLSVVLLPRFGLPGLLVGRLVGASVRVILIALAAWFVTEDGAPSAAGATTHAE